MPPAGLLWIAAAPETGGGRGRSNARVVAVSMSHTRRTLSPSPQQYPAATNRPLGETAVAFIQGTWEKPSSLTGGRPSTGTTQTLLPTQKRNRPPGSNDIPLGGPVRPGTARVRGPAELGVSGQSRIDAPRHDVASQRPSGLKASTLWSRLNPSTTIGCGPRSGQNVIRL